VSNKTVSGTGYASPHIKKDVGYILALIIPKIIKGS
jgi:hypothetical protein